MQTRLYAATRCCDSRHRTAGPWAGSSKGTAPPTGMLSRLAIGVPAGAGGSVVPPPAPFPVPLVDLVRALGTRLRSRGRRDRLGRLGRAPREQRPRDPQRERAGGDDGSPEEPPPAQILRRERAFPPAHRTRGERPCAFGLDQAREERTPRDRVDRIRTEEVRMDVPRRRQEQDQADPEAAGRPRDRGDPEERAEPDRDLQQRDPDAGQDRGVREHAQDRADRAPLRERSELIAHEVGRPRVQEVVVEELLHARVHERHAEERPQDPQRPRLPLPARREARWSSRDRGALGGSTGCVRDGHGGRVSVPRVRGRCAGGSDPV